MSYYKNLRTFAACQERYDNTCPPEHPILLNGCKEEDYDERDESDVYGGTPWEGSL